jgi:hypothetical protein
MAASARLECLLPGERISIAPRVRRCTGIILSDTGYFAEVPLEAIFSSMAMNIPTHIAPKPNQGRNEFCALA